MEIIKGNATSKLLKLIDKNYKLFKIIVVTDDVKEDKFYDLISKISEKCKVLEIVTVPSGNYSSSVVKGLIDYKMSDDVGAIIVLGDNPNVLECLNNYQVAIINIITEPYLPLFLYKQDYVVIDEKVISKCSYRDIAKCYSTIASLSFYLLEQVFDKAIFYKEVDNDKLIKIEQLLLDLTMMPSIVVKSTMGKNMLIDICLQLKDVLLLSDFNQGFVYKIANNIIQFSKYKNINLGESLMISNIVSYKMFDVLLSADMLKSNIGFDCEKRINLYKNNYSLSHISQSFLCDKDISQHIDNFNRVKVAFKAVFITYYEMLVKHIKIFRELYYDKGLSLNKYLNDKVLLTSINCVPETYDNSCFATFIRDVGLLNKI